MIYLLRPGLRTTMLVLVLLSSYNLWSQSASLPVYKMHTGTVTTCAAWFLDEGGYSTGYEGYPTPQKVITFNSADNSRLLLHFDSLFFNDRTDALTIFDGNSTAAPVLTVINNAGGNWAVRSSGNSLTIRFYASGMGAQGKYGWRAKVSCLNDPAPAAFQTVVNSLFSGKMDKGDFDNDGDLDLVHGGGIFRNESVTDSTFYYERKISPVGRWIEPAVAVADYDNDNDMDVLVTGRNADTYLFEPILYLNQGNGTFVASPQKFAPSFNGKAKAVDFNNDGKMDISYIGRSIATVSAFKLYINNGDGSFTEKTTSVPGLDKSYLDWADCDKDGDMDLLINGSSGEFCYAKLFINNNGELTEQAVGLKGTMLSNIRWVDMNADGLPEIINTGIDKPGTTFCIQPQILINKGGNKFESLNNNLPSRWLMYMDFADYDNDNDLDIICGSMDYNSHFTTLYKNEGNGEFKNIEIPGLYTQNAVFWKDFNKDGKLDIFCSSAGYPSAILKNMGNDVFTNASLPMPQTEYTGDVAIADFDHDGREDILYVGKMGEYDCIEKDNSMMVHNLTWSYFSKPVFTKVIELATAYNIGFNLPNWRFGDFDNDGLLDVIVTNSPNPFGGDELILLRNNGNNSFTKISTNLFGIHQAAVVDLDNDGSNEIFTATNVVYKWTTNKLVKVYADEKCHERRSCSQEWLEMADYNNDGFIDAAVSIGGNLYVMKNNGKGRLAEVAYQYGIKYFRWADFDNDNDLDLLCGNGSIMENRGNDVFDTKITGINPLSAAAVADFNGDGFKDVFSMRGSGAVHRSEMFYNQNGVMAFIEKTPPEFPYVTSDEYYVDALEMDVDNDGDEDIVYSGQWCNTFSGILINKANFNYPNLHLRKPAENQKIVIGSTSKIEWSGKDIGNKVTLHLSVDSGRTYQLLAADIPSSATGGSYQWNTNGLAPAKYCFVKVSDKNGLRDLNNKSFELRMVTAVADNPSLGYQVKYYPNPTSGRSLLELQVRSAKKIYASVIDQFGVERRRFFAGVSNGQKITTSVDLSGLPNGLYYLKFISEKALPVLKLIKQ
ncbi:T9SS type A sorting domain-containing protein [Pseudoflavitalea sp. G-6-1-2]|uniref:FG-GAP-like repeat-containing protein n=1 Tax=Pseudoflavitalea sp. G-6-1-2 TaxID=2728841 RepID=UPI001469B914|nr:FG-GAP-like repeat-containing protein [Pseudoflavitalea sp. G-6-1-2]NML21970.1 T9SS type A sorting domain-containing protein [Pseudoflavitalea sp. G-6-1-2]